MAKRIHINEELCTGCGNCETGCEHGAIRVVDGKARLVREDFCDGLGACIGTCPTGALKIVELPTGEQPSARPAPAPPVQKGLDSETTQGGCPGSRLMDLAAGPAAAASTGSAGPARVMHPELGQWPIQLHLIPPNAPFLRGKELVLLASCAAVASPDVQWRFIRGRAIAIACPKLDRTEGYLEKLAAMIAGSGITKVIVVRMQVPCCGGLSRLAQQARELAAVDLAIEEAVIALDGSLVGLSHVK